MKYNLQHIKIDVSDSPNIDNLIYMSEKSMAAHPRQTNLALLVKKCFEINVILSLLSAAVNCAPGVQWTILYLYTIFMCSKKIKP